MSIGRTSIILVVIVLIAILAGAWVPSIFPSRALYKTTDVFEPIFASTTPVVAHVPTPKQVKAIYMSSWVAGTPSLRAKLVKLIDETELNSLVIDIKDYTGRISYEVYDPELVKIGSVEKRIADFRDFMDELHDKDIYVIGRISTFQDAYFVGKFPQYAVKNKLGEPWKDYKGIKWIDAGAKPVWDYLISIANDAYAAGVDEINFDYIRFPSDGNMKDIYFPYSEGKEKPVVLTEFFEYVREKLGGKGMVLSADLFGLTTSTNDDLGIGQVLEPALKNFDYVAPMVYPSHYPPNFIGIKNPAAEPYKVIHYAMSEGVKKAVAASTSPLKLRPWLQDFDLGATYTADMVRAQMTATYDVGLDSWMLWDAANHYTPAALLKE